MNLLAQYGLEEDTTPTEGDIDVQGGDEPKKAFDSNIGDDVETGKPATVQLPAASDGDKGTTTTDDGHQKVTVANEEVEKPVTNEDQPTEVKTVGPDGDTDDSAGEVKATVTPEEDVSKGDSDNGDVEEDDPVNVEQDPKDVNVLPDDAAGPNTTVSNEERLRDAHTAVEMLTRYGVAVEGYLEIARKALDDNAGLSRETALAIKLGVESFDVAFGNDQVVPALENFGEVASRESTTIKTIKRLEDSHEKITTARDHAREMIEQL